MHFIDWVLGGIPILIVVFFAIKSQKYVKSVADFLSAGRVARRYVLSVASGEAMMGLISVIAIMEMYYSCGFAVSFWSTVTIPIMSFLGLFGFCSYRFRETRAMTMGQFFEIRYNKAFRVFAAVIQSISGIVNYAIFPAVGARFLMYFLDLPIRFEFLWLQWPTFGVVMFLFLGVALMVALMGGQVTIMVTDCVQGILSYPMYVLIVGFFLLRFSWFEEMAPTLLARAPGESFLNPRDVENLRDFNLFYVFAGIFAMLTGWLSWGGLQGYRGAAKSPHEGKMSGLLGTWRGGFSTMMYILLAVVAFTYLNHRNFASQAREVRTQLACKVINDVMPEPENANLRQTLETEYKNIPERNEFPTTYQSSEQYKAINVNAYEQITNSRLDPIKNGKKKAQTFRTIYSQMLVPLAIREILPIGLTGIFCALMIFLMLSTDTTYMHSWGSVVVQDLIVPLRKNPFTPAQQIRMLRYSIAGVCAFAFFFSYFFAQMDFILMFFAITGAIWSGAGIVITLGLYWKKGTPQAAFSSLIAGSIIAVGGIVLQSNWVQHIYPFLERHHWVEQVGSILQLMSMPFNPYIVWEISPHKFPINSVEIAFIVNLFTTLLFVTISLLTSKKDFNMDRMLHRGIYSENYCGAVKQRLTVKEFLHHKIIGIDENYTTGDKVLAWSVFGYSFGYSFGLCFLLPIIWNVFAPWPQSYWIYYFFINNLLVAGLIGIVSTIWFGICCPHDLYRLFKELDHKKDNILDDGRVINHVSADDAGKINSSMKSNTRSKQ